MLNTIHSFESDKDKKAANLFFLKIAKIIRIITIPPVCAIILITILYTKTSIVFNNWYEFIIAIFTIAIIPVLAYPVQKKFNIIKLNNKRTAERNLAIIFSISGYFGGLLFSIISKTPNFQQILYITYLLTGLGIAFGTFILKIKFSGHMAGISGPIITLSYLISYYFLFLYLILAIVMWASLYTKNHTFKEASYGSLLPIMAFIIANLIIFIK